MANDLVEDTDPSDDPILGTRFDLTIELGNAAMRTPEDIADALRSLANRLEAAGTFASEIIMDQNGARVGSWSIQ